MNEQFARSQITRSHVVLPAATLKTYRVPAVIQQELTRVAIPQPLFFPRETLWVCDTFKRRPVIPRPLGGSLGNRQLSVARLTDPALSPRQLSTSRLEPSQFPKPLYSKAPSERSLSWRNRRDLMNRTEDLIDDRKVQHLPSLKRLWKSK